MFERCPTIHYVYREFLGQAWLKEEKKDKAPNICLMTERFNDVSVPRGVADPNQTRS